MKKLIMALALMPVMALADREVVNGIEWSFTISEGKATVENGRRSPAVPTETAGAVEIPSMLGGCIVTSIGEGAFYNCDRLTSVIIPSSVTSIGEGAFEYCNGLTSVTIPEGVTSIGDYAFFWCDCLTSVTIPEGVTSIGDSAFSGCDRLTAVTIPEGVTSIGDSAFFECNWLIAVTIPSSVTFIGPYAFASPIVVVFVKDEPQRCVLDYFGNQMWYQKVGTPIAYEWKYSENNGEMTILGVCPAFGDIAIPSEIEGKPVTSIGPRAFFDCSGLTSVTIPEGVTSIGSSAFSGCGGLTSVTIPSSVTSIGEWAFSRCFRLTSVMIPSSVKSIGKSAFWGCSGLTSITLPFVGSQRGNSGTKESLFGYIFGTEGPNDLTEQCYWDYNTGRYISVTYYIPPSLKSVVITDETVIGDGAFSNCSGLTSVTIPSSVTGIGYGAFFGCAGLASFVVDPSNGAYASVDGILYNKAKTELMECPLGKEGSVTIPKGVTRIWEGAFSGCTGLTSVTIPSSVTFIDWYTFSGCSGLTSMTIPASVTGIAPEAFFGCSGLISVTIPSSLVAIGWSVFGGCNELRVVYVGEGDTNRVKALFESSGDDVSRWSFVEKKLDGGPYTEVVDGIKWTFVVSEGKTQVSTGLDLGQVISTSTKGAITIPSILGDYSVTSIGSSAFSGCSGLTSMTIPASVTSIGDEAFYGCSGLTRIIFKGETPPNASDDVFAGSPSDLKACVLVPTSGWREALIEGEWHGRKIVVLIPPDYDVAQLPRLEKQGFFFMGWMWANGSPVTDGHVRTDDEEVVPHWISDESMSLSTDDVVTSGGNAFWRDAEDSGVSAVASGKIGDSQESWLEVEIPGPVRVSFDWRVSCEESMRDENDEEIFFDGLEFLVDGKTIGTIAGEVDWTTVELDIMGAGPYVLRWRYFKDESDFDGDDGGAIANLVVTPYATVAFAASGDATGDPPEGVTCLVGDSVKLPSAGSLIWAKHRFVGWSDGEAVYQPGDEYEVALVKTVFTAVWEEKRLAAPTITVPEVFAADTVEVVISAESGASVHYTLDGSVPTSASPLYMGPFSVADDCTIRAIALRDDWYDSAVATATTRKATYTVRFDAGSCGVIASGDVVQTVKYGGAAVAPTVTPDAWYAFDGWDKPFDRVTSNLTVTANYRLAARAVSEISCYVEKGVTSSETGVGVYLDDAAEDGCVIRMTEDNAWCAIAVDGYCRVSCAIEPEDVVCSVDGEEREIVVKLGRMVVEVTGEGPHEVRWTGKAQLSDFEVVSAALLSFAAAGGETGDVPAPIAMYEGDEVTLPGPGSLVLAKHAFTGWRDGEAVLQPGSVYAGPLEAKTLTAVWEEKQLAAPVIDAPEYFEAESIQVVLDAEDGAEIRYTLDGTAPSASSALYEGPFAVGETVTIKAIALRDDWFDSAVAERKIVRGPWTFGEYLEMPKQMFSTSGDAEWVRAKGEGEEGEGSYVLRSGTIGDSQESVLSMKVQGAGTVSFKYRVSSQAKKGVISDGLAVRLDGSGEKVFKDGGDTGWKEAEVSVSGAGEHTVAWVYYKNGDGVSEGEDCAWLDWVKWTPPGPSVVNDPGAVVTGDAETGYVVVPSVDLEQVEINLNGIDPSKVTVEVSVGTKTVAAKGAKVKVVSGGADITEFLNVPAADGNGVIDLTKATVKEEIVKETLDPAKGAVIELNAANPKLTTPNTRIGLFYTFSEGRTLGGMERSASKTGDGEPFSPEIKVKGGNSAFYSIGVGKSE